MADRQSKLIAGGAAPSMPDCEFAVLADVATPKGPGVSYWALDPANEQEVQRVVAAYIGTQKSLNGVTMRYVSTDLLDEINVSYKKSPSSGCPDKDLAKNNHYDLQVPYVGQAYRMVEGMAGTRVVCGLHQVVAALKSSVAQNFFSWSDLKPELVHQMIKEQYIKPA